RVPARQHHPRRVLRRHRGERRGRPVRLRLAAQPRHQRGQRTWPRHRHPARRRLHPGRAQRARAVAGRDPRRGRPGRRARHADLGLRPRAGHAVPGHGHRPRRRTAAGGDRARLLAAPPNRRCRRRLGRRGRPDRRSRRVNAPIWLSTLLSILMVAVACAAVARMVVAGGWRRAVDYETETLHLLAGLAAAGLISSWAGTLPRPVWTVVFVAAGVYLAVRAWRSWADTKARRVLLGGFACCA